MNQNDTIRAIHSAGFTISHLQAALNVASPVEAMILMPLIAQAQGILNTLEQLKGALQEVQS